METDDQGWTVKENQMIPILPTARSEERINEIPYLPDHTLIVTNRKDFNVPYITLYSEAEGYWKALNDAIHDLELDEPFIWLADDIRPIDGWYEIAEKEYQKKFKDGLGLMVLNDLNLIDGGAAFAVITKKWLYVLFGEPKFPDIFAHNFLDTVIANYSKELGRYHYCPLSVVEHLHYSIGKSAVDEVYENNKKRARANKDAKVKNALDSEWVAFGKRLAKKRLDEMKNKRAFFILGPEGSGTHMMRNFLVDAGCHWEQRFEEVDEDTLDFYDLLAPLVIRRSLPHAHKWPDLEKIHTKLEAAGYNIFVIFTIRDFHASARSVVRRDYGESLEQCYYNQYRLVILLGDYLESSVIPENFVYSPYEAFINYEGFRRWLAEERLELEYPSDFQIFDGNKQYYQETEA